MSFIPPPNFGMVEADLYRSGQPNQLNFPFLEKLHLRKVIYLAPDEPAADFLKWLDNRQIELVHLGEDVGKRSPWKPVSEEMVVDGLHQLLDPSSYPLIVMCNLGRHRTGTMIGCMRKLQGWSLTSILEECACSTPGRAPRLETRTGQPPLVSWRRYRRHAGAKFRLLNEQFIELFDVDLASRMRALEPLLERARGRVGGGAAGGAGGWGQSHSPRGPRARVAGQHPADGTAVAPLVPTSRTRTDMSLSLGIVRWYSVFIAETCVCILCIGSYVRSLGWCGVWRWGARARSACV